MRAGYTSIFGQYYELLTPEELAALHAEIAELKDKLAKSERLVGQLQLYREGHENGFW